MLCVGLLIAAGCLTIGYRTKPAILATLTIWGYFYAVDSINEKAIHSIAMVLLVLLAFAPCNRRYSVDALRATPEWRGDGQACSFVLRLLQLEFAQVYFFAGVAKMMNPEWVNGTVTARLLNGRWATETAHWVSVGLPDILPRAQALVTILFETMAGFLLFVPWARPWVIGLGLCFHLAIQVLFHVGFLGIHFMLALLVLFPEPEKVASFVHALRSRVSTLRLRVQHRRPARGADHR
jgi:hypothetical protein